jgi:hypothetical protein
MKLRIFSLTDGGRSVLVSHLDFTVRSDDEPDWRDRYVAAATVSWL